MARWGDDDRFFAAAVAWDRGVERVVDWLFRLMHKSPAAPTPPVVQGAAATPSETVAWNRRSPGRGPQHAPECLLRDVASHQCHDWHGDPSTTYCSESSMKVALDDWYGPGGQFERAQQPAVHPSRLVPLVAVDQVSDHDWNVQARSQRKRDFLRLVDREGETA